MEGAIHSVCELFDLHGGNGLEVLFVNAQMVLIQLIM